ncbi:TIGR03086 family metal-binding protein [Amycolatopsis sp. NPDC059657]|uniref:TIGR03086 family metal-binding protein n=1 Tax=Amycolatopsis sp. NPDC059657 TaxID=3346899 RepID=UPI00366FB858
MADLYLSMTSAAGAFKSVVAALREDDLAKRTPCDDYTVRALVNHLLYWGPWLVAAGRKEPAPAVEGGESDNDLTQSDWATALEKQTDELIDVFGRPGALDGMSKMGSVEMPASVIAGMVLAELALHGWDLAVATGQELTIDEDTATALYAAADGMAEQARAMGVFGPEVPVPASASTMDRALGLVGRDPAWRP